MGSISRSIFRKMGVERESTLDEKGRIVVAINSISQLIFFALTIFQI
jgi:hypothetical protein